MNEVFEGLAGESFDFVIDLHYNLRSSAIKRHLKKESFSFNKLNIQKWLLVNLKVDIMPDVHIVDRYLDTLKPFKVENDRAGLDYFIAKQDEVDTGSRYSLQEPYVAVVIGAALPTKKMPVDRLISICKQIPGPVLLVGGPEDKADGNIIAERSGVHVINTCGLYNLGQSASIIRQSRLVITHDTGMMHVASAFNKNMIVLWGNTVPAFGMYPYNPGNRFKVYNIENQSVNCRPCSKIGYKKCPYKHFKCMNDLSVTEIIEKAQSLF